MRLVALESVDMPFFDVRRNHLANWARMLYMTIHRYRQMRTLILILTLSISGCVSLQYHNQQRSEPVMDLHESTSFSTVALDEDVVANSLNDLVLLVNPCEDSLYKALKNKNPGELNDWEQDYVLNKDEECEKYKAELQKLSGRTSRPVLAWILSKEGLSMIAAGIFIISVFKYVIPKIE